MARRRRGRVQRHFRSSAVNAFTSVSLSQIFMKARGSRRSKTFYAFLFKLGHFAKANHSKTTQFTSGKSNSSLSATGKPAFWKIFQKGRITRKPTNVKIIKCAGAKNSPMVSSVQPSPQLRSVYRISAAGELNWRNLALK